MYKNYKHNLLQVFLFCMYYTTIFILVLSLFIYIPIFYQLTYAIQDMSYDEREPYVEELILYFMYIGDLTSNWSQSELLHYQEVRNIYTSLLIVLLSFSLLLYYFREKVSIFNYSKISLLIIFSHLLIFIDFTFFWDVIFHPLLFSNSNWIIKPGELSFILFPYSYFSTLTVLLFSILVFIHGILVFKDRILSFIRKA